MINKIIEFLKCDYRSVSKAVNDIFKGKIPEWVILIYYIIMVPIGLILYPFAKIFVKVYFWIAFKKIEMKKS